MSVEAVYVRKESRRLCIFEPFVPTALVECPCFVAQTEQLILLRKLPNCCWHPEIVLPKVFWVLCQSSNPSIGLSCGLQDSESEVDVVVCIRCSALPLT